MIRGRGRPLKMLKTNEQKFNRLLRLYTEQAELQLLLQWAENTDQMETIVQRAIEQADQRVGWRPGDPPEVPAPPPEPIEAPPMTAAQREQWAAEEAAKWGQAQAKVTPRQKAVAEARKRRMGG